MYKDIAKLADILGHSNIETTRIYIKESLKEPKTQLEQLDLLVGIWYPHKDYYEYIYPIFDKRSKPNLSNAALETLSIIAYNPKITRAEIETIRGVGSDGTIYKLLEYNLIANAGKLDAPGKPTTYVTTNEFLKMFGLNSLDELPDLPRYKLDENRQIVIDDIMKDESSEINEESKTL